LNVETCLFVLVIGPLQVGFGQRIEIFQENIVSRTMEIQIINTDKKIVPVLDKMEIPIAMKRNMLNTRTDMLRTSISFACVFGCIMYSSPLS